MVILRCFIFSFLLPTVLCAQHYALQKIEINTAASFRSISVVDNQVAWVGGTLGTVGQTTDGGTSWTFNQVKGHETTDFRSLYAFNEKEAVIANTGSPAHILITEDGGKNWKTVYTNSHPDAFFDGIIFWNKKEGIVYGDPIEGKMLMLYTRDGGLSWAPIASAPPLEKGEVSFAASGTGIRCNGKNIMICTGGVVSRLWTSNDKGKIWSSLKTPIIQGQSTTGIFSFVQNNNVLSIVGGDYKNESLSTEHNFYSVDHGNHWLVPTSPTRGYRECVEAITKETLLAVGPTGVDVSYNNGKRWQPLSDEKGLHVIRKARKGSLVLLAGANGQLFILKKSTQ